MRSDKREKSEHCQTNHMQQPVFLLVTLARESSTLYAYQVVMSRTILIMNNAKRTVQKASLHLQYIIVFNKVAEMRGSIGAPSQHHAALS
jgi:hypothetical protein